MSLHEDIVEYIRSGETDGQALGLEVEHFVVNDEGVQIGFDEVTSLIKQVAENLQAKIIYMDGYPVGYVTGGYSVTLEPACQFEISIDPKSDIESIKQIYKEFLLLWIPVFANCGYHIITKGNLPLVESGEIDPDDIPLSHKKRYQYMDAYFRNSGKYGKYMMRASSSVQISVDYSSEDDLVRKLLILQKISPILMIALENKSFEDSVIVKGSNKTHLLRIQEWNDLDPSRTGFYPHSFDDDFGYDKIADVISETPLILLTDGGDTSYVGSSSAQDLIRDGIVDENPASPRKEKLIEHFISMGFFHFRIKKYIEIRVADSVPLGRALSYVALIKGLIYSEENLTRLETDLADITSVEQIEDAVDSIIVSGLDAKIYGDQTVREWYKYLLELADNALPENEREYLKNV
ncbi:glutamate--cysteine ligase [Ruminococcaceae bacterium R-25]|nr:glutamate--cysteine ligase [Ruminococcaceae bacterium R-25]SUQ22120.1 glutamate--cysteine ligase [Oscillospiraceae bacterium]